MITLQGQGIQNANPLKVAKYPLVILSHGHPGNEFTMVSLAENIASKGYVVVSIAHADSTYSDHFLPRAFLSALRNRILDISFVIDEVLSLNTKTNGPLYGLLDSENIALVGYSTGAYGVLNKLGGGLSESMRNFQWDSENLLIPILNSSKDFSKFQDSRIKAAVLIAPIGWNQGFWSQKGLETIKTPLLIIAGDQDPTAGYSPGVRNIYEACISSDRYLLTFENASHHIGGPPAPFESWAPIKDLPITPIEYLISAEHYIDPVWENTRLNNITQHFITAFLGKYLNWSEELESYLDLIQKSKDGRWSTNLDGSYKSDHTYWKGFKKGKAIGLNMEHLSPDLTDKTK